jgi:hypothetical protein
VGRRAVSGVVIVCGFTMLKFIFRLLQRVLLERISTPLSHIQFLREEAVVSTVDYHLLE